MEGAFRAIECRLAQMNVFSHYCLTFSANDCVFSLNEQQKVYNGVWLKILEKLGIGRFIKKRLDRVDTLDKPFPYK